MRETRTSGSEGGGTEFNRFSLPLSCACKGVTTERCKSSPGQTLSGPVTNSNCVAARRGGEQLEVNHQSVG